MTKYNVLLSKTHSLAASLGAAPTRKGQTSLKAIAPHPYVIDGPKAAASTTTAPAAPGQAAPAPTAGPGQPAPAPPPAAPALDPHLDVMLEVLLDGRRAPSVLRADIANSARLRLPHENGGIGFGGLGLGQSGMIGGGSSTGLTGGMFGGIREGVMTAEELRAEEARLDEVRRAHDARCARGVEAVRQLKDKVCWCNDPYLAPYTISLPLVVRLEIPSPVRRFRFRGGRSAGLRKRDASRGGPGCRWSDCRGRR